MELAQPHWAACSTTWLSSWRKGSPLFFPLTPIISDCLILHHCEEPSSGSSLILCSHWGAVKCPKGVSCPDQTSPATPAPPDQASAPAPSALEGCLLNSLQLMYSSSVLGDPKPDYPCCDLTSAESSGIMPSLDQAVQSMQPRVLLAVLVIRA